MSGMLVADMIANVREATGEDEEDLPDAKIIKYLNRSLWEILDKIPFKEKEKSIKFQTEATIRNYDVPVALEAINAIFIEDPVSHERKQLEHVDIQNLEGEFVNTDAAMGFPIRYAREGVCIKLDPVPDDIYDLILKANIEIDDLEGITNEQPEIRRVWHEIIEFGAKWRRFNDMGDYNRQTANRNTQLELLKSTTPVKAKEKEDYRLAGLEVIGRKY